jgi:RNA polymerase sigma-70 factor, ECF subfamily
MLVPDPAADDSALISAALQGKAAAFEQLFDRYYAMIHAFAYRLCLRAADADDIAQETFIKAARGLTTFRGGDFRSWLYRIAANSAWDFHRNVARRKQMESEATEQMLSDSEAPPGGASEVGDALASLPPNLREAVALVYFEGLNHAEAARVLGCAETTVSWRLFRAKRQLKALLSRSYER